jgi:hypothetical protein
VKVPAQVQLVVGWPPEKIYASPFTFCQFTPSWLKYHSKPAFGPVEVAVAVQV